jgi:hypothetical protein
MGGRRSWTSCRVWTAHDGDEPISLERDIAASIEKTSGETKRPVSAHGAAVGRWEPSDYDRDR